MTPEESLYLEIKLRDDRWKELKRYVETSILKDLHYAGKIDKDTYLTSDANWGFDMGMIWISDFMREMEKK